LIRYQLISNEPDGTTESFTLNFEQSDVLAGIFCVLLSYISQLFPYWESDVKTGSATILSVGLDKLTNALFWYTFLRSLCSGCLKKVFCHSHENTMNAILLITWKLFSEVVILLLIMLFSDRWGHPDTYCV